MVRPSTFPAEPVTISFKSHPHSCIFVLFENKNLWAYQKKSVMPRGVRETPSWDLLMSRTTFGPEVYAGLGPCLLYTHRICSSTKYGRLSTTSWGDKYAHRWSWKHQHGTDIPVGMMICHKCDIHHCVNPFHLYLGTPFDNAKDMMERNEMSFNRSLSNQDVKALQAMRSYGATHREIAEAFGISKQTVRRVLHRRLKYVTRLDAVGVEEETQHATVLGYESGH
jgi:hypothetical protein